MAKQIRQVDNRIFLLGLDGFYRESIKAHERGELLQCARQVALELEVDPAEVPVEGYYHEDEELREYFQLMRVLQEVPSSRCRDIKSQSAIDRLIEVSSSRLYGHSKKGAALLSGGVDPLSKALRACFPNWTIDNLTRKAYAYAVETDDFSMVALASIAKDPILLAALRESVVLYAIAVAGAAPVQEIEEEFVWSVDAEVERRAVQFVSTFNALFNENLPVPNEKNAAGYFNAADLWSIVGRCARIGWDDTVEPLRHYHWAIKMDGSEIVVEDFWDTEFWTTERYAQTLEFP